VRPGGSNEAGDGALALAIAISAQLLREACTGQPQTRREFDGMRPW
jgi:hypothetical protein